MSRGTRLSRSTALGVAVALVLGGLVTVPVAASDPTACRVKDLRNGTVSTRLQRAVDRAKAGDTLRVKGTCHGITTVRKSLTIVGYRTSTSGPPTLDGDDLGSVLTIGVGTTVGVRALTVRDGNTDTGGGGIANRGSLSLRDVVVRSNEDHDMDGGGIHNWGTLRLSGSTRIQGNLAAVGGGIANEGSLVMNEQSAVRDNVATVRGGGISNSGTVTLNEHASISRNTAPDAGDGGGIMMSKGRVTLNDRASISHNSAQHWGGGIYVEGGSVTLNDTSVISGNTADDSGGGVFLDAGRITLHGSSAIRSNRATRSGGGLFADGDLAMDGTSTIRDNRGGDAGAGVAVTSGSIEMHGSSAIRDNTTTRFEWRWGAGLTYWQGVVRRGVRCAPGSTHPNVHDNTPVDCFQVVP